MLDYSSLSPVYTPSYVFPFEREFDFKFWQQWIRVNFHRYIYAICVCYLVAVFTIRRLMADRKPFDLRIALISWNLGLALFSIAGASRLVPEMAHTLSQGGFRATLCDNRAASSVTGIWFLLFVLSKVPEMGDTLFIVLRKRPLIFLHWYHHVETAYYSLLVYPAALGVSRYFVALNYSVHSVMYSYYALRAAGIRVPKPIAMAITTAQVAQMFVALFAITATIVAANDGSPQACTYDPVVLYGGLATYTIYALLFVRFFVKAYCRRPSSSSSLLSSSLSCSSSLTTAAATSNGKAALLSGSGTGGRIKNNSDSVGNKLIATENSIQSSSVCYSSSFVSSLSAATRRTNQTNGGAINNLTTITEAAAATAATTVLNNKNKSSVKGLSNGRVALNGGGDGGGFFKDNDDDDFVYTSPLVNNSLSSLVLGPSIDSAAIKKVNNNYEDTKKHS